MHLIWSHKRYFKNTQQKRHKVHFLTLNLDFKNKKRRVPPPIINGKTFPFSKEYNKQIRNYKIAVFQQKLLAQDKDTRKEYKKLQKDQRLTHFRKNRGQYNKRGNWTKKNNVFWWVFDLKGHFGFWMDENYGFWFEF